MNMYMHEIKIFLFVLSEQLDAVKKIRRDQLGVTWKSIRFRQKSTADNYSMYARDSSSCFRILKSLLAKVSFQLFMNNISHSKAEARVLDIMQNIQIQHMCRHKFWYHELQINVVGVLNVLEGFLEGLPLI